jgi:hypothetical protein
MNLAQLASGENRFMMVRYAESFCQRDADSKDNEWLPFRRWYGEAGAEEEVKHPPTLAEIFPREHFEDAVDTVMRDAYKSNNNRFSQQRSPAHSSASTRCGSSQSRGPTRQTCRLGANGSAARRPREPRASRVPRAETP